MMNLHKNLFKRFIDVSAFMKNLRKLVESKDLREEMGKRGREYLEKEYCIERSADIILNSIKSRD